MAKSAPNLCGILDMRNIMTKIKDRDAVLSRNGEIFQEVSSSKCGRGSYTPGLYSRTDGSVA